MCEKCVEAVKTSAKKHGYEIEDKDYHDILWNFTAFPFSEPEYTSKQVEDFFRGNPRWRKKRTLAELYSYASARVEAEMDAAMAELKAKDEAKAKDEKRAKDEAK